MSYFYYKFIRKTIIQFMNVFNNISIAKFNNEGDIDKIVNVPLKLSAKQKFWYWIHEKKHEKRLPMMAINFTGINPAISERGYNSTNMNIKGTERSKYRHPIPWDYSFELYIASKYLTEVDQILEQILPWFDPFILININIPEINNNLDLKVTCNGASQDKTVEIPEEDYRTINWTINFLVKGYLMKPVAESDIIEKINLNYNNKEGYSIEQVKIDENGINLINYEELHGLDE